ncbi:hypothetical protein KIH79_11505 [Bifidobacterium sp. 82T10]|uniref:Uncharacterized protein n=1 Tax=Bifidobacterium miconis TaxID=2834435 RepID=A0ABS6WHK6_9BIFI|nr:hypothetical protein [Bifidobacterium miconis]MBW3093534.1 hypothetical protein [Bifidobacterium miconis]
MDERWMRALRAKGINVGGQTSETGGNGRRAKSHTDTGLSGKPGNARHQSQPVFAERAKPFKATGHKGGISRQGN